MSSSIAIPKRRMKLGLRGSLERDEQSSPTSSSFASSSSSTSYTSNSDAGPSRTAADKRRVPGSTRTEPEALSTQAMAKQEVVRERRFSLLSSSLEEAQHTVINVGGPDTPRLITCVRSSQGFDWNQDLFLPSYMNGHDSYDLEHKQDPVEEIVLTEEERANMLPS